jgi:tetratricopeptide (TPR) repeat protein
MRFALFALVALLLLPHFAAAQEEVELSVRNRTSDIVTVFALWNGGTRTRLGELRANQTNSYTIEVNGERVTLSVQVAGQRGATGRPDPSDYAEVRAGEAIEFEIRGTGPLDLFHRSSAAGGGGGSVSDLIAGLTAADAEPGTPRMSPYTGISQGGIQQAQAIEQDSLRMAAYREVHASILEGLAQEDDNPMAYLHLGIANAGLKNYIAADSAFDRAEAMYPPYFDEEGGTGAFRLNAWLDAYTDALLKLETQDSEEAVELFEMANMLYDRRAEAYLNIGVTAAGLGDMAKSIEAWRSAIAVIESPDGNPGDSLTRATWDTDFWVMSHSNLGRLLVSQGRSEEAVAVFETLLDRDPENSDARSSLAMALAQSGQGDGALTVFDEILARDDGAPLDYYNAGVTLNGAGELDKAALAFEKTIARSPMYKDALQNLVQTYFEMEDFEALVPHSQRLLELDPFNDYIHRMHVQAMAQIGHEDLVDALGVLQALPFQIDELVLQPLGAGCRVTGVAINNALDSGTALTLRFTFYDDEGNPVGTADTEVTVSDPEVAHPFDLTFDSEMQILGYSYELVG